MANTLEFSEKKKKLFKYFNYSKFIILYGGRRSGKTVLVIYYIILRLIENAGQKSLIVRRYSTNLKALKKETIPFVLKAMGFKFGDSIKRVIGKKGKWCFANASTGDVTFSNGSMLLLNGADEPDKLLGLQYQDVLTDEGNELPFEVFNQLISGLHGSKSGHKFFITCNPPTKRNWIYKDLMRSKRPKMFYQQLNYDPTESYADPEYLETLQNMPPELRKRFLDGEWSDDVSGLIFDPEAIHSSCTKIKFSDIPADAFKFICLSIDPAVTANKSSDDTGMVVLGYSNNANIVIIDNLTGKYNVEKIAEVVNKTVDKYRVKHVYIENNNGGMYLKDGICRLLPINIGISEIHAKNSKKYRAEAISYLFSDNKVRILDTSGNSDLIESLLTWKGLEGEKSPNDIDAMVHGMAKIKTMYIPSYKI